MFDKDFYLQASKSQWFAAKFLGKDDPRYAAAMERVTYFNKKAEEAK